VSSRIGMKYKKVMREGIVNTMWASRHLNRLNCNRRKPNPHDYWKLV